MTGYIFRFDGPVFDDKLAARGALKETQTKFEFDSDEVTSQLSRLPRLGLQATLRIVYPQRSDSEITEIARCYGAALKKIEGQQGIFDGARDLLFAMQAIGIRMAVISTRAEAELLRLLEALGIRSRFQLVIGGEAILHFGADYVRQTARRLSAVDHNLALIGDSDADCDAAHDAGIAYYHADWTGEPSFKARTTAEQILSTPLDYGILVDAHRSQIEVFSGKAPQDLVGALLTGNLSFFAGAGISMPSGIGGWKTHYLPIIQKLGGTVLASENDFPSTVQLLTLGDQGEDVFRIFKESFRAPEAKPNSYHYAILRSRCRRIWTTNYDQLFEIANEKSGGKFVLLSSDKDLLSHFAAPFGVIKVNGDFFSSEYRSDLNWGLLFLEEQFDLAEKTRPEIWRHLEDWYRNAALIFVGVSFQDPALRRVLAAAARAIPKTRYTHYLLMKAPTHPLEHHKFNRYRENLRRHHIETLFFSSHDDIQEFVSRVSVIASRPVVGFSGTIGKPEDSPNQVLPEGLLLPEQISLLCKRAGRVLASAQLRVCSGHGRGVGVASVEGAFQENPLLGRFYIRREGSSRFSRTAPAIVSPDARLQTAREAFLADVDVLIALGGNRGRKESGTVAEIEMALSRRIPVLIFPHAGGDASAFAREELPNRLRATFSDSHLLNVIASANQEISDTAVTNLDDFVNNRLVEVIEGVLAASVCASDRHHRDGHDWPNW